MMRSDRHDVVIVGLGTLGSMLFQLLVREALGKVWAWVQDATVFLVDFDSVLPHNLAKSGIYRQSDVGMKKVAVAQAWARGVNPNLRVISLPQSVEEVGLGPFLSAAVVLIAVDIYLGKMLASRQAWRAGVPLIMIGELAGGTSLDSRYRWFRPGPEAPCLECNWQEEYIHLRTPFPCSPPDTDRTGPATRLTVARPIPHPFFARPSLSLY
jgi:molybdopterin/thiamine biosynthesis adenylyltransferase